MAALMPSLEPFGIGPWWQQWCAAGNLKRAARSEAVRREVLAGPEVGAELVGQLRDVLAALPARRMPLAVLARRTVGDAHGLDETRPLGRLAVTVVGTAFGVEASASARTTWAAAGALVSSVASTVLALGVRGWVPDDAGSPGTGTGDVGAAQQQAARPETARLGTARALEALWAAGMPAVLTLEQVRSGGVQPAAPGERVYVCENPTVVEVVAAGRQAVARPGRTRADEMADPRAHPVLVCTSGQPSTAVVELLEALSGDGAEVWYHGDFDWPGLRIARTLAERVPWAPWRFMGADYEAAVARAAGSLPLSGVRSPSPWDPELAATMARHGLAIEEEAVVEELLGDIAGSA